MNNEIMWSLIALAVALCFIVILKWGANKLDEIAIPNYISDMENELGVAKAEVDASIARLRDELGQVIARELPKAVKAGKSSINIELYASKPDYIAGEAGLQIPPNLLSVLQYHNRDHKWAKEKLIDPSLDRYIDVVSLYGHTLYGRYVNLHLMLKEV